MKNSKKKEGTYLRNAYRPLKVRKKYKSWNFLTKVVTFISRRVVLRVMLTGASRWCDVERGKGNGDPTFLIPILSLSNCHL